MGGGGKGQRVCCLLLQNYWGPAPPAPSSYAYDLLTERLTETLFPISNLKIMTKWGDRYVTNIRSTCYLLVIDQLCLYAD